jgi:putative membrane protein
MNNNVKWGLILIGVALALVITVPLFIGGLWGWQGFGMMGRGMMGGYGNNGSYGAYGGGWLVAIIMIVFWALIISGIVVLIVGIARGRGTGLMSGSTNSALEILKQRYAKGEISKQEFEEKKKDLM